jgi:hypothetical protein
MGGVFNTVNLHLYHYAGNNPVKYTDPDGKFSFVLPFPGSIPIPKIIPWSNFLPWIGTIVPPIIATPLPEVKPIVPPNNPSVLDDPGIDMGKTETWPKPPVEGPFVEGEPTRGGPRKRGEKSLFDKNGGEWRPHKSDNYHKNGHWDYKPPSTPRNKYPKWEDIDPDGKVLPAVPLITKEPMA